MVEKLSDAVEAIHDIETWKKLGSSADCPIMAAELGSDVEDKEPDKSYSDNAKITPFLFQERYPIPENGSE